MIARKEGGGKRCGGNGEIGRSEKTYGESFWGNEKNAEMSGVNPKKFGGERVSFWMKLEEQEGGEECRKWGGFGDGWNYGRWRIEE